MFQIKISEREEGKNVSKGNMMYNVCIYVGDFDSKEVRVIYSTNKESKAQEYLHDYLRNNPEICKAYIERKYSRNEDRRSKYMREEDEE